MALTEEEKKERRKKSLKKYYENNREKITEDNKKYHENNPDKKKQYNKKYRKNNPEKRKESAKKYRKNNREKMNLQIRNKYLTDTLFNISRNISALIRTSLKDKGYTKKSRSFEILGCSFEDFKIHLEKQFESWMNWENKGNPKDGKFELNKTWDIDHIIPLSSATIEEEIIKLNHYTNLRPLCSYYNRFIKRHHLEEDLVDNL